MSSTPQFSLAQLEAARKQAWHQTGEPLQTLDAARQWIADAGLVLFAPRAQHIPAPAPSLVEATLGESLEAASPTQAETARSFVARLLSEGNALPLNLLGGPGDAPDYVVSAQMFSFVFTLHGNKLWKQPPSTSGSVKVTPLALGVYEMLTERGAMSAAELASELGREVTEAAILRALNELWTQLRVLPLLQQGNEPTLWELTTKRFTKTIKAGANAGQPTALSALVSAYLSQALLASEEEIAAFLSPLAARSRIREVIHGLSAGRQLEPVVLEGKELLHVPGTLPEFPAIAEPETVESAESAEASESAQDDSGRIKRFAGNKERGPHDFKGKPAPGFEPRARKPFTERKSSGERKPFGARPARPFAERTERERRPFKRDASPTEGRESGYAKPWNEDRKPRTSSPAEGGEARPKRTYERSARPPGGGFAKREGYAPRPSSGERRSSSDRGPARKSFGDKPAFRKERGEGFSERPRTPRDGERKPFVRREGSAAGDRPKRPYVRRDAAGGERPAYGGSNSKPREVAPKRTYTRRDDNSSARPPRSFDRGSRPDGDRPKRPFVRREGADGERSSRPAFGAKRPYVRRDAGEGERPARPAFGAKRPYVRREGGEGERSSRPARPSFGGAREGNSGRPARPYRPAGDGERPRSFAPRGDRPSGPARGKFGSKPGGGGFAKRDGGRPGGKVPFGGKAAFGKRPAGAAPKKRRTEPEE